MAHPNGIEQDSEPARKKRLFITESPSPIAETLEAKAREWGFNVPSIAFARRMDTEDPLRHIREMFYYPKSVDLPSVDPALVDDDTEDSVYLSGNSLGLLPRSTSDFLQRELDKWAKVGAHGHFIGHMPWVSCDDIPRQQMALLVGGQEEELVIMNGLTVNQHLMMSSFYNPTPERNKILLESKAFPSDHYAIQSQIEMKGYDPADCMLCVEPRKGEETLQTADLVRVIKEEGDRLALIMLPGVQYYTGQLLDMATITAAGHAAGCYVGFDLAHAVGNVELKLHDWQVDFAVWCSYKYLNSGAGGIGAAFVHRRNFDADLPQLNGWWSHKKETRFKMDNKLDKSLGASSYRVSNPSFLLCASLEASLRVFSLTTMESLCRKSRLLTGYLEYLLQQQYPRLESADREVVRPSVHIITPSDPAQRGCQLSVKFSLPISKVFEQLQKRGVVCDMREPDVLRLAPTPLYNSFTDVHRFVRILGESFQAVESHLES